MSHTPPTADATLVLIADERPLVRDGIKALLGEMLGAVRCLDVEDVPGMLRAPAQATVCLALVGLNLSGMQGGRGLQEFARLYPAIPLVVVSPLNSPEVVRRTMNVHSVCAFVPISASIDAVRLAITAAMQGRKLSPTSPEPTSTGGLTPRQEEVHRLMRDGLSNKMIAGTLGISEGTVKNHISEIFKVLNATNRTQAARLAVLGTDFR